MFNILGGRSAALPLAVFAGVLGLATAVPAQQLQHYTRTNLVSDSTTDANLVNGWGMSRGTGTPWWISDNGTGKATLYSGTGSIVPLVVTIPTGDPSKNPTGTPTGQVFNGTADFQLNNGQPAKFIFATEDGTISGWNGGATAEIHVNTKGASSFKGLAMATISDSKGGAIANFLYAADFRKGRIRVYDEYFHPISLGEEAFRDDRVRHGFASMPSGGFPRNARSARPPRDQLIFCALSFRDHGELRAFDCFPSFPAQRERRKCAAIFGRRLRVNTPLKFIPPARLVPWPVLKSAKFQTCMPASSSPHRGARPPRTSRSNG